MTTAAKYLKGKFFPGEEGWRGRNATIVEARGDSLTLALDRCPCPEHNYGEGSHTISSSQGFTFRLSDYDDDWELEVNNFSTTRMPARKSDRVCLSIDFGNPLSAVLGMAGDVFGPAPADLKWFRNPQKDGMYWNAELMAKQPKSSKPQENVEAIECV